MPFEIRVEGDKQPIYEETLEDVRRFNENPALPFNAFGTLAMARAEFDANSGSSQVFILLKVKLLLLDPTATSCTNDVACYHSGLHGHAEGLQISDTHWLYHAVLTKRLVLEYRDVAECIFACETGPIDKKIQAGLSKMPESYQNFTARQSRCVRA